MLKGKAYKISELTQNDIEAMYTLMALYYENIVKENFISDLMKKDNVIVLKTEEGIIKGFSTIIFYDMEVYNQKIKLVFSGDTIVDKEYWANNDIMQVWIKFILEKQKDFKEKLYWLLISKGYKTYKCVTSFYNEFYPRYDKQTPDFEKAILDKFGETFYKGKYDKNSGIIIMNGVKDYLKAEYATISENKLKDKNVKFFVEKNPDYYKGNELVCITEISYDNFSPSGRRVIGI